MIVSKCPLRVSLAGGSTDLQPFIDKYKNGAVINFSINLYTYILLHKSLDNKYNIHYSKIEREINICDIKNDIAREVLKYFDVEPITIIFDIDVPSNSGLASSSSYVLSLIKAISLYKNLDLDDIDIVNKALEIERKFNPLTGYQDPLGCIIPGLKEFDFYGMESGCIKWSHKFLNDEIFDNINMFLIDTTIRRRSTDILKKLDLEKAKELLNSVKWLRFAISWKDAKHMYNIINQGWEKKKETSSLITQSLNVNQLDKQLSLNRFIKCHRLCGSGGGGYFLVFVEKEYDIKKTYHGAIKINIDKIGLQGWKH